LGCCSSRAVIKCVISHGAASLTLGYSYTTAQGSMLRQFKMNYVATAKQPVKIAKPS